MKGLSSFILFQPNCLICICFVTRHQDSNMALFYFPFLLSHVISCRFFFSFIILLWKVSLRCTEAGTHTCTQAIILFLIQKKKKKTGMKSRKAVNPVPDTHVSSFLSLCLSEREPFNACSVAADKAGHFVCGSHSEKASLGSTFQNISPTIDLHYPLHWLSRTIHFCSLQTIIHLKPGRMGEAVIEIFVLIVFLYHCT